MTRRANHQRLTPSQRRLLAIIHSFKAPATERQIKLRIARLARRSRKPRR
jgi:hypothetical protein